MNIKPLQISSQVKTELTKALKGAVEVPTIKKVTKTTITEADKVAFEAYTEALKYKTGITLQEVNELFKKEGNEFLQEVVEYLFNKYKMSETIRPSILIGEIAKDNLMEYEPLLHSITIGEKYLPNINKEKIFSALRHEFQHARQNLDILRHETIGKDAIDYYVKTVTEREKQAVLNLANISDEKLVQKNYSKEEIQFVKKYKALYNKGEVEFNNYLKSYEDNVRTSYERLRKDTIDKLGLIKEGSKSSQKCKLYLNDFKNINYYNPDGTINNTYKYLMRITEIEANLAGEMAEAEVTGQCYFKKIKAQIDYLQKNQDMLQKLDQAAIENFTRQESLYK